jgi:predicted anti-sigma-YlaC factor YlaD
LVVIVTVTSAACSPATMGMNRMADALSSTASAFGRDDDPEFVRVGAPSTLKMVEMMLDDHPLHPGLLLTACSGYTQYAYAFLHVESQMRAPGNAAEAADLKQRAARMYERARGYCVRALEIRLPKGRASLAKDPKATLAAAVRADIPILYWTAAAWGGSLAVAENPILRLAELSVVRALFARALELDETWEAGTIHEALISIEALPVLLGGSAERARKHFNRAVELSQGQSAFAFVTFADSVSVAAKNRGEFEKLLRQAIAIDVNQRPAIRLANLIAQKRARFLLSRADTLFAGR